MHSLMPQLHVQFSHQHRLRAKVEGHPLAEGAKHAARELNIHTVAGVAVFIHVLKLFSRGYLVLGAVCAQKGEVQSCAVVEKCHSFQRQLKLIKSFCLVEIGGEENITCFDTKIPVAENCSMKLLTLTCKTEREKKSSHLL